MKGSFLNSQILVGFLTVMLIAPGVSMAQQSAAKKAILTEFHAQKDACKQAFMDALDELKVQKSALKAMRKQATDPAMIATLEAEHQALEAAKSDAAIAKEECMATAVAAKDAALAALGGDEEEDEDEDED